MQSQFLIFLLSLLIQMERKSYKAWFERNLNMVQIYVTKLRNKIKIRHLTASPNSSVKLKQNKRFIIKNTRQRKPPTFMEKIFEVTQTKKRTERFDVGAKERRDNRVLQDRLMVEKF